MFLQTLVTWMLLGMVLLASPAAADSGHLNSSNPMNLAFQNEINELQTTESYTLSGRPIESLVTFYLYTRNSIREVLQLNDSSINDSKFKLDKPTKFIIHGYMDNGNSSMPQITKDNLLQMEDVNVIIVDWGKIARKVNYFWIAKQVPVVGQYVARLLDYLSAYGSNRDSFHLIGHSLGAHVAGFAGAGASSGRPGRISGLDPAKPEFHKVEPDRRLDPNDADFVDCIHTCGGWLGLMEPICHVDFYPNGGTNVQPGCSHLDFGRCSHIRSHEYFAESILGHSFEAFECGEGKINSANCKGLEEQMGYYINRNASGVFYGTTNSRYPFGIVNQ